MKARKTFIIRHKVTKEIWCANSGKTSWGAPGHAKLAWGASQWHARNTCKKYAIPMEIVKDWRGNDFHRPPKFDGQDVFEIVELVAEQAQLLDEAVSLIEAVLMIGPTPTLMDKLAQFYEKAKK